MSTPLLSLVSDRARAKVVYKILFTFSGLNMEPNSVPMYTGAYNTDHMSHSQSLDGNNVTYFNNSYPTHYQAAPMGVYWSEQQYYPPTNHYSTSMPYYETDYPHSSNTYSPVSEYLDSSGQSHRERNLQGIKFHNFASEVKHPPKRQNNNVASYKGAENTSLPDDSKQNSFPQSNYGVSFPGYRGRGRHFSASKRPNYWGGQSQKSKHDTGYQQRKQEEAGPLSSHQRTKETDQYLHHYEKSNTNVQASALGNGRTQQFDGASREITSDVDLVSSHQRRATNAGVNPSASSFGKGTSEDRGTSKRFTEKTKQVKMEESLYSSKKKYSYGHNQHFYGDKQAMKYRGSLNRKNGESAIENDESQRSTLTEQLSSSKYECMICCENIRADAPVWSCSMCYHVFHLQCIQKWARSSINKEDQNWRCPGCQNISSKIPYQYRCFCGSRRDPRYIRGEIAHSCGEVCNKSRQGDCKHPCTILCHPGPCPPCCATVWITCDCGKLKKNVRCSKSSKFQCDQECWKQLNCGIHNCRAVCHSGSCQPCQVDKTQECLCKKSIRKVLCGSEEYTKSNFRCMQICGKLLDCANHTCKELCHSGECKSCEQLPQNLLTCCCGQSSLSSLELKQRLSCLDPIPTCPLQCNKPLPCGSNSEPHLCEKKCHPGECGPCEKVTHIRCQCGSTEKQMPCGVAFTFNETNPLKCQRRCGKKKTCGRHKCSDNCCVKEYHICEIVCGQKLSCGLHKCEELCHRGNCKRCLQASFDELTCHCGAEVLEPPVACGTKPPECRKLCSRQHNCQHPVRHNCHSEEVCPPCTELTDKMCAGSHMMRKNVPCHLTNISCGYPCQKLLPCGQHKCQKPCHKDSCLKDGVKCSQPCQKARPSCGHPCDAPCHTNGCPDEPCKAEVTLTCPCGSRTATSQCLSGGDPLANLAQFQRLSVQSYSELGDQGLELSQFLQAKKSNKRLECDSNCAMLERNRRLALALEIKNPDLQAKLGNPAFTEFLKDYAKKNLKFASNVEKNLNTLVQSAKQSLQSSRSFAFQSMNRDQRRFVHELAEFYGCQTQSYDSEPNKNVVATAQKEKCWLPNVTLTQLVSKGQTVKAPPPLSSTVSQGANYTVLEKKKADGSPKEAWSGTASTSSDQKAAAPIDYFDFTD
ncbi:protein shuttle craft [Biomphalaria glabrata]